MTIGFVGSLTLMRFGWSLRLVTLAVRSVAPGRIWKWGPG